MNNWNPLTAIEYLLEKAKHHGIKKKELEAKVQLITDTDEDGIVNKDILSITYSKVKNDLQIQTSIKFKPTLSAYNYSAEPSESKISFLLDREKTESLIEIVNGFVTEVGPVETGESFNNYKVELKKGNFPDIKIGESYKNAINKILKVYSE